MDWDDEYWIHPNKHHTDSTHLCLASNTHVTIIMIILVLRNVFRQHDFILSILMCYFLE